MSLLHFDHIWSCIFLNLDYHVYAVWHYCVTSSLLWHILRFFNGFHRSHRRGIALYYPMNWPKRLQIPSNRFSTQTVWTNSSIRKAGMCLGASHERLSVLEEVCGQPAWRKNSMWWVNLWCHTVDLCVREAVRPLCHLPNLSTSTVHWLCHWFNVMSVVHLVTGTHTL